MIKEERFTFWIPAFDLVSKVNACVEKVLDRNIHDVFNLKPSNKGGRNKFSFVLVQVKVLFKSMHTSFACPRTYNFFKKGGESSYGAKIPLQVDNAGFSRPNHKGVTADRPCFLLKTTIF
jgi:hypothetical protein